MELFRDRPSLMVSLARNDPALGAAAAEAGADALKTHVNVGHRASGNRFGSVAEERAGLEGVLALGLPTGLVVGGAGEIRREEMAVAAAMGFSFFDAYLHHAPAWYVQACGSVAPVVALSAEDTLDRVRALEGLGFAAVEASLAAPEDYGTPLPAHRLADYARLADLTPLPVIVPSQHALTPDDVPALISAGIAALLLGVVVTGSEPSDVATSVRTFRKAIDEHAARASTRPLTAGS